VQSAPFAPRALRACLPDEIQFQFHFKLNLKNNPTINELLHHGWTVHFRVEWSLELKVEVEATWPPLQNQLVEMALLGRAFGHVPGEEVAANESVQKLGVDIILRTKSFQSLKSTDTKEYYNFCG